MTNLEKSMLRDAYVQLAIQEFLKLKLDPATTIGSNELLRIIRKYATIFANFTTYTS